MPLITKEKSETILGKFDDSVEAGHPGIDETLFNSTRVFQGSDVSGYCPRHTKLPYLCMHQGEKSEGL